MWRNSLEAFEQLGMKVSFMISRIDELVKISEIAVHSMKHGEFEAVANAPWKFLPRSAMKNKVFVFC
ncbi:hypothetical protein MKW92_015668 [Papaver armeniacum]|nr:hypothetical protein MKW92_015668 [Papaver armeniacum]